MIYDINSYEIFLKGDLNPIAYTSMDESAIMAEKKFKKQINKYVDSHLVKIKVEAAKIEKDPKYIETLLSNLDFIELGFEKNDKIAIEINTDEIDEQERIEICIKSESKGEFPSLESEKITFYDNLRTEIREGIKRSLKEKTLSFDNEDKLKVYINQQYQFGLNLLREFYQRRKFIAGASKSLDKISKVKKPNETNANIISFIISDLWGVINFIENNYKIYLSSEPIDVRDFENNFNSIKSKKDIIHKKSGWKKWLDIQLLELKPNIAGLGININEIISRMKKNG